MSHLTGEELLEKVLPFRFLSPARRKELVPRLELRRFHDREIILRQGETSRSVYLLAEGLVEAIDDREPPLVISKIEAGHYFGERAPLFEKARRITIRARGHVVAYSLPGAEFLRLVDEEPVFSAALANTLKIKQGIFLAYQQLYARILSLINQGEFLLAELLSAYRELCPALHPGLHDDRIDVGALGYAVQRLPDTVTRTNFYYLAGDLPLIYRDPDAQFSPVETRARRRSAWQPLPGKLLILLRDGISDITDFLTCLSCYAVEARKIRRRIRSSANLLELKLLSESPDPEREKALLPRLKLSEEELAGLRRIWPQDFYQRLREILLHHEDVGVECDFQIDNYNSRASEVWVSEIRERARQLVDLDDPQLEVHIISSNTHSVGNCLSPYLSQKQEEILAWGREHHSELAGPPSEERPWGELWPTPRDLLYVLARLYQRGVAGVAEERRETQRQAGQDHLSVTAFTGIEVDLFDPTRLSPSDVDPGLEFQTPRKPTLLVNVDYAFGQQAEEILLNLLLEFGQRVRSVNVVGKAGGLSGERGDMLLPRATLLQTNDELYPLPNQDLSPELLQSLAPERSVHQGPVLTVAGTLLQDRVLLYFYKRIWKCVGLEMEGSFFARQLISAMETGVIRPDVKSRFVYYVSDVPLEPEENLSEGLAADEGVPPLYAVTRAILRRIFQS